MRALLTVILSGTFSFLCWGQLPHLTFFNTSNSPMPSNRVNEVIADKENNIWIFTTNGIVKYNNDQWVIYNSSNSSLPYNSHNYGYLDLNNNLWIKIAEDTLEYFMKFDGENWVMDDTLNFSYFRSGKFAVDQNGVKWIQINFDWPNSPRMYRIYGHNVVSFTEGEIGLDLEIFIYVACDLNDIPIIASFTWDVFIGGIATVDNSGEWIHINTQVFAAYYDSLRNSIWTVEPGPVVRERNLSLNSIQSIAYPDPFFDMINYILTDRRENIWVKPSEFSHGRLFFYDKEINTWTQFTLNNTGIPDEHYGRFTYDYEGNVWIGTNNNGVMIYNYDIINSWFPLQVGNKWFYNYEQIPSSGDGVYEGKTIKEIIGTEQINFKHYYLQLVNRNSEIDTVYLRYEPFHKLVYSLDKSTMQETLLYDLRAVLGDTVFTSSDSLGYVVDNTTTSEYCNITYTTNVSVDLQNPSTSFSLADGIGLISEERNEINGYTETLYAFVVDSIVCGDTSLTDINDQYSTIFSFQLFQNYPNPFNPSTKIKYSIREIGKVTLTIYDVLGQKVQELINEVQNGGTYQVDFETKSLSSGIYFYELRFNGSRIVKKLNILK